MNATRALFRKEFLEQWRTNKVLILAASFFLLGVSGPLSLKFLPEIMKMSGESSGLSISLIRKLTATDYQLNFFSQMSSMPMLILILVAMGAIAGERERGTHVFVLTKPVSKTQFIVTKYLTYLTVLAGALLIALLGGIYYSAIFTDINQIQFGPFFLAGLTVFSYMAFMLAMIILSSSLFRSALAAGGLSFLVYLVCTIGSGLLPSKIGNWLPFGFIGQAQQAFAGKLSAGEQLLPALVGFALSAIVIAIACFTAEQREI
jgi:ABC-2 type transport system permease protein